MLIFSMQTLYYSRPEIKIIGSGVSIKINNDSFVIQELDKISNIMITAKSGYISLYALKLMALKRVTLTLHNLNGEILYHIIPEYPNQNLDNRILQYEAYLKNKDKIADKIVKIKKEKYEQLLKEYSLPELTSDKEGLFSMEYIGKIGKLFNDYGYNYYSRQGFYNNSNQKAVNIINALLNFYYGLIEHRLLSDIGYYGYDYNISFLHVPQYNKLPLTYDLIEFLRSDIDHIVLKLAENRKIKKSDFELTNKGYYLLKEEKITKYLKEIRPIENKTRETVEAFSNILQSL